MRGPWEWGARSAERHQEVLGAVERATGLPPPRFVVRAAHGPRPGTEVVSLIAAMVLTGSLHPPNPAIAGLLGGLTGGVGVGLIELARRRYVLALTGSAADDSVLLLRSSRLHPARLRTVGRWTGTSAGLELHVPAGHAGWVRIDRQRYWVIGSWADEVRCVEGQARPR